MGKQVNKRAVVITVAAVGMVCVIGLAVGLSLFGLVKAPLPPFSPPSSTRLGKYRTAAVSSDGVPCSDIGRDMMVKGGNAMDAAIATVFCIGTVVPQSTGIGGGFLLTVYDPIAKKASCLNAREVAPLDATEDMFNGSSALSQKGGLAVAVPGELAGSWAAHQRYGKLPWADLIRPSAELAENGVTVSAHLANALREQSNRIKSEPSLWFFLDETTGEVKKEGDVFKRPAFAQTLRTLADFGVAEFYNGTLGDRLVQDIQKKGGIMRKEDLMQYRAEWVDPVRVDLKDNLTVYSIPPPGSGVLAAYILNILDLIVPRSAEAGRDPVTYHRIAESFKHAYAQRTKLADPRFEPQVLDLAKNLTSEELAMETAGKINDSWTSGDPDYYGAELYVPDDSGTSHVSVLDRDGMAVAVTSTINLYFGAGFASEQTGIILNDEMDDFSAPNITNAFGVPPSPANFIKPGKRPLSSMSPTIVVHTQSGDVRLIAGAAGGTKITTATALTVIRNVWFGENIKEAIDSRRMHHQLFPMEFQYESGFPTDIVNGVTDRGHNISTYNGGAVVCAISKEADGFIYANSDWRKTGDVAGIDPVDL